MNYVAGGVDGPRTNATLNKVGLPTTLNPQALRTSTYIGTLPLFSFLITRPLSHSFPPFHKGVHRASDGLGRNS